MPDAATTSLMPIVLGGAIALSGTVVSQLMGLLSSHIQRRHERDVTQRERLERMADAIGESLLWFHRIPKCKSIEEIQDQPPPPAARRAAILADLYFPDLSEPAADYANALLAYHHLVIDCFQPGRPASAGAQVVLAARSNLEIQKICEDALQLRVVLDKAISKEAKKYWHT
jgi:hypothetical protein